VRDFADSRAAVVWSGAVGDWGGKAANTGGGGRTPDDFKKPPFEGFFFPLVFGVDTRGGPCITIPVTTRTLKSLVFRERCVGK